MAGTARHAGHLDWDQSQEARVEPFPRGRGQNAKERRSQKAPLRAGGKGQLIRQGSGETGSSTGQEWASSGLSCAANPLWNLRQASLSLDLSLLICEMRTNWIFRAFPLQSIPWQLLTEPESHHLYFR